MGYQLQLIPLLLPELIEKHKGEKEDNKIEPNNMNDKDKGITPNNKTNSNECVGFDKSNMNKNFINRGKQNPNIFNSNNQNNSGDSTGSNALPSYPSSAEEQMPDRHNNINGQ